MTARTAKCKRRPKYGRIFFSIVFFLGLLFLLAKLGFDLFFKDHETYLVDYGNLDIKADYNALVIQNEIVVNTNYSGKITYYADEGASVVKGEPIAEVFNDGVESESSEDTALEVSQKQIEFDYTVLEYDIMTLKNNILFAISQKEYDKVPALKSELILKLETREKLEGENKFLSNRTASYTEKTIGEGRLAVGEKANLYAPAEGILTFNIDGYEDYLTIDNIYNINYDDLSSTPIASQSVKTNRVDADTPIFKLIDQSTYYFVIELKADVAATYQVGRHVVVNTGDATMDGEIFDIFSNGSGTVAVIRLHEANEAFYSRRHVACTVINENYKGLKIYVDTIVNLDGTIGVYRIMSDRRLQFVPIEVIGYDADYAIVQSDQFYQSDEGIVRTLSANQEIIRNAAAYKEGDLIE
jgi:putative membrane fusion protein